MKTNTRRLFALILFPALALLGCAPTPITSEHFAENAVAIQGYSPVSYFQFNAAERGSQAFSYKYNSRTYYFTSQAQIALFKSNPKKYVPRYGEYCPYSLALGRRVAIDPNNFKIENDRLWLFHSSIELSTVDCRPQSAAKNIRKSRSSVRDFFAGLLSASL